MTQESAFACTSRRNRILQSQAWDGQAEKVSRPPSCFQNKLQLLLNQPKRRLEEKTFRIILVISVGVLPTFLKQEVLTYNQGNSPLCSWSMVTRLPQPTLHLSRVGKLQSQLFHSHADGLEEVT